MRKPGNQTNRDGEQGANGLALVQNTPNRLIQSPAVDGDQNETQQSFESVQPCPSDVADYLKETIASLETMARRHKLEVLSLMLAMAREQAEDDALSARAP